jgi:L-ribulose-5-phosphate 4-epimerase
VSEEKRQSASGAGAGGAGAADPYRALREQAYAANVRIVEAGLVMLTWGNASAADPERGVFAIKPSGVPYRDLGPEDMVVVAVEDGRVVDGSLKPSSDTPTHRCLYEHFEGLGGIVHTHSHFAVCFAQAERDIPCFGTTHADHFYGPVPVTRPLTQDEITRAYEYETGRVIVETFRDRGIDPFEVPGVLVSHHGPFAWGRTADAAAEDAIVLEEVARMGLHTEQIRPGAPHAPQRLVDKHFQRKHGPHSYYGQG